MEAMRKFAGVFYREGALDPKTTQSSEVDSACAQDLRRAQARHYADRVRLSHWGTCGAPIAQSNPPQGGGIPPSLRWRLTMLSITLETVSS